MTSKRSTRRRLLFATHGAAFALAFLIAALMAAKASRTGTTVVDTLGFWVHRLPSSVAYSMGSQADARVTLQALLSSPQISPLADELRVIDRDIARSRLALLNGASRKQLRALCERSFPACPPAELDRWLAFVQRARKVKD